MGKFCVQCGAKLEENAAFCSKCGAPSGMPKKDKGQAPDKGIDGKEKSGGGKRIAIISVIAVVLILLLAGIGSAVYLLSDEYQCKRNMRLADENYEAEAYEEALPYYEAALELDDTLVEAYLKSADIYSKEDSYEKALKILKRGMKKNEDEESRELLNEEYEKVCLEGADFLLDSGEYEQAIEFLKEGQEVVGNANAAALSDKEKEIQEKYLFPSADKIVAALFELYAKNNASPMQELLGFLSEEDVYREFFEEGVDLELANQLNAELVDVGVVLSDEEIDEIADSILKVFNKIEYTTEIMYESDDDVMVVLEVYGFSLDKMNQVVMSAADMMLDSITYEDQLAITAGETDVLTGYMRQYIRDILDELSEIEINTESTEVLVSCEKLLVNVNGTERIVWLPSNMEGFAADVDSAIFH